MEGLHIILAGWEVVGILGLKGFSIKNFWRPFLKLVEGPFRLGNPKLFLGTLP